MEAISPHRIAIIGLDNNGSSFVSDTKVERAA